MATRKKPRKSTSEPKKAAKKATRKATARRASKKPASGRAKKPGRKSTGKGARKPGSKSSRKPARASSKAATSPRATPFLTPDAALRHWQGHRRLTRRVIEAFPEDKLFTFAVGGMRTFGDIALELVAMAEPMARGLATETWSSYEMPEATSRAELLRRWDESTAKIDELWSKIPQERFQERRTAFGQYEGPVYDLMLYVIDNEIHHRGQGYVYLRALGLQPPAFWERA